MKVVILAGGFGSRLADGPEAVPKPLVPIGPKPIIWHIMKIYEAAGLTDFVVCCGHKGQLIKQYFANYFTENSDLTVDLATNTISFLGAPAERWTVTLIDTGLETMTGGRLRRIRHLVAGETFCMTYGDGVADIDIRKVVKAHRTAGRRATITAVRSPGRFGILDLDDEGVTRFHEKPDNEMGWINGGFFVLEPAVLDYVDGDDVVWEAEPLERLAREGQLAAYRHEGFWRPMDTLRDRRELEALWASGRAPWKIW